MSKIEFKISKGVTPLDNIFIDDYMPLAPAPYSVIYIYGLRCAFSGIEISNSEIAEKLDILESDVKKAWKYWRTQGIIQIEGKAEHPIIEFLQLMPKEKQPIVEETPKKEEKPTRIIVVKKPSYKPSDVAALRENNTELDQLLNMAETTMNKVLTHNDIDAIISFNDYLGLPPEVISMLLTYCQGKNMNYMEKVAEDWSNKEIKTIERVDAYISRFSDFSNIMHFFGVDRRPSEKEQKVLNGWLDEYKMPMEIIKIACERALERTGKASISYAEGILKNWNDSNARTVEEIERLDREFNSKNTKPNTNTVNTAVKTNNSFVNYDQKIYSNEELEKIAERKNRERRGE